MTATTVTPRADMTRIREDHWRPQTNSEDTLWASRKHTSSLGTQLKQGHRTGWWEAVEWVLNTQLAIDELTQGELLAEIRKAEGSVFWPLLSADPTLHAECPRCGRGVVIDKEGLCPECAYEFQEND